MGDSKCKDLNLSYICWQTKLKDDRLVHNIFSKTFTNINTMKITIY